MLSALRGEPKNKGWFPKRRISLANLDETEGLKLKERIDIRGPNVFNERLKRKTHVLVVQTLERTSPLLIFLKIGRQDGFKILAARRLAVYSAAGTQHTTEQCQECSAFYLPLWLPGPV